MQKKCFFLVGLFFLLLFQYSTAQETSFFVEKNKKNRDAVDLFEAAKYGAAQKLFGEIIQKASDPEALEIADAYYYSALCAVFLYNQDAEARITEFIKKYPQNSKNSMALFYLANTHYLNKSYEEALKVFQKLDPKELPHDEQMECYFKMGYCHFLKEEFAKAKPHFLEVKLSDSKYANPAQYYYAHVLYAEPDYNSALLEFEQLKEDPNFGEIVPFYITQIYFLQGKTKELLEYAPKVLDKASPKRRLEIVQMIGESYYKEKDYAKALEYFSAYVAESAAPSNEDFYRIGYCYYELGNFKNASEYFAKINPEKTALSQNALFYLGASYVKINKKEAARSAFLEASKMEFDESLTQEALYNYAKLSVEIPNNPYNESIKAFLLYSEKYPKNPHRNEINEILANLYFSVRNYADAMALIEKVTPKTKTVKEATQKIALNRGIELFNGGELEKALALFKTSLENDYNDNLTASALYLKGESYYRLQNYEEAENAFKEFFVSVGGQKSIYYPNACYSMGYALMGQKKYSAASNYFERYVNYKEVAHEKKTVADAYNRMGDCAFITKQFKPAIESYNKSIALNTLDADYAIYQKSLCMGAIGDYKGKIDNLRKLLSDYPQSSYCPAVYFELGNAYLVLDNNAKALENYQTLVKNYPQHVLVKETLLKMGMVEYNRGNDDDALQWMDKVVKNYAGTPEAYDALVAMKNIHVNQNRIDDYFNYVKDISNQAISASEQDSLLYTTAETRYLDGDCESSIKGFENYLKRYPQGFFILNANYYLADCYYRQAKYELALPFYEAVLEMPKSNYTEKSLLNAARINFDIRDYEKALFYFLRLSENSDLATNKNIGKFGTMRCYYRLQNYTQAISSAQKVLAIDKISEEEKDEANYVIAHSAYLSGDTVLSAKAYSDLKKSKNGEYAGEAQYRIAEKYFLAHNYMLAEKSILAITANPTSEYWLAKSFILWAKIYRDKGNLMQAKQTLLSIIENYDGEELVNEASAELSSIEAFEAQQQLEKAEKARKQHEDVETIDLSGAHNTNEVKSEEPTNKETNIQTEEGEQKNEE